VVRWFSKMKVRAKMKKRSLRAYLEDLVLLAKCLFPLSTVRFHPKWYREIMGYSWPDQHKELFIQLIESLTLLHKHERRQDDICRYYSTKEDFHQALFLISPLLHSANPHLLVGAPERRFYRDLWLVYGDDPFTVRQAMFKCRKPKSTSYKYLRELMRVNLAEQTGKSGQAYLYQLRPLP